MRAAIFAVAFLLPSAAFAADAAAPRNYFMEFYVFHIIGALAVMSLVSEAAERRGYSAARLRRWWNWVLLLSFAACALSGLALFLPLGKPVSRFLFKVHVWTGSACCWAGLYHSVKRMRAMLP